MKNIDGGRKRTGVLVSVSRLGRKKKKHGDMKEYVFAYFGVKVRASNGNQSNTLLGSRNGFWRAISNSRSHKEAKNDSECWALHPPHIRPQRISKSLVNCDGYLFLIFCICA